jgi:hypothetical protein
MTSLKGRAMNENEEKRKAKVLHLSQNEKFVSENPRAALEIHKGDSQLAGRQWCPMMAVWRANPTIQQHFKWHFEPKSSKLTAP